MIALQRFTRLFYFVPLLVLSTGSFSQSDPQVQLGQMIKQTMKESWADIEPLGKDEQGLYYMAIPYTEVIAGPMIADADFYLFGVSDQAELVQKNTINFMD